MFRKAILSIALVTNLLVLGCATAPTPDAAPPPASEESVTAPEPNTLRYEQMLAIQKENERLRKELEWVESIERKSLALQDLVGEALQYENILETITHSREPNLSQVACAKTLRNLRELIVKVRTQLEAKDDLAALAASEVALEEALYEAKSCVVNYGEIAFVYFRLDTPSRDGRSVPGGLNPHFEEENQEVFKKITATCSRAGVIHLYGYSCDLGTDRYNEALAYDRAKNLSHYVEKMLTATCGPSGIRLEAHLGGIIRLIDPEGKSEDLLEDQRARHRVVALFLFNQ